MKCAKCSWVENFTFHRVQSHAGWECQEFKIEHKYCQNHTYKEGDSQVDALHNYYNYYYLIIQKTDQKPLAGLQQELKYRNQLQGNFQ